MDKRKRHRDRRGVLLLLILGILAMFGLVVIALVVIARHARDSAAIHQRVDQYAANPAEDLGQAFLQVVRGTNNPNSVIGPHSLLEDMYGKETARGNIVPVAAGPDPPQSPVAVCGGQLIEFTVSGIDLDTEQEIRRRVGCVLTMLVGPAAGRSTRIVGYRRLTPGATTYHRLQVVAFEGISSSSVIGFDYSTTGPDFLVNGEQFSGTGFGFHDHLAGDTVLLDYLDGAFPIALLPNPTAAGYQTYLNSQTVMANEDYDAPDYQNMLLAMVVPPMDTNNDGVPDTQTQVVAPSLHRPALANYWANQTPPTPTDDRFVLRANLSGAFNNVTGPWDVDNDGDGIADSIWVNLGMPVRTAADGRRYRPLFAILCLDLDGRLNLNAHGCLAHVDNLDTDGDNIPDYYDDVASAPLTYAGGSTAVLLARGQGFGPAEISLLPLFVDDPTMAGDPVDRERYFRLMQGGSGLTGRYAESSVTMLARGPGISRDPTTNTYVYNDPLSANRLFSFYWDAANPLLTWDTAQPLSSANVAVFNYHTSVTAPNTMLGAFGSAIDPKGTMAVAIDRRGQPVYRPLMGWSFEGFALPAVNDPYELNLSRAATRGQASRAADNPFTVAELERVLRPYDVDASMLPQRLANLHPTTETASLLVPTATRPANRRLEVTSDSWDPPVPNLAMTQVLRDRLTNDLARHVSDLLEAASSGALSAKQMTALLPGEVLAGLRLDLNRPFGNGQDDNNNGVVDDPAEFWGEDRNANGVLDPGEDLNGNGSLDVPPAEPLPQLNAAGDTQYTVPFDANNDGSVDARDGFARQLYARHLYVLLMALVDQNWYPPSLASDPRPVSERRAEGLAQFAVNVVDFRDRDAIMTPFEYDITPFADDDPNDADGDGNPFNDNPWNVDGVVDPLPPPPGSDDNQTYRGLVWGCERPELLISETLAIYDTAMEDRDDDNGDADFMPAKGGSDDDPDQRFRPEESLFVEIFNPSSPQEARPAEFYYDAASSSFKDGVRLHQLTPTTTPYPVWRLAIVSTTEADTKPDPDDRDIERTIYFIDPDPATPGVAGITDGGTAYYPGNDVPSPAPLLPNRYAVIGSGYPGSGAVSTTYLGFRNGALDPSGNTRRLILTPNSNETTTGQVAVYTDGVTDTVGSLLASVSIRNPISLVINGPKRFTLFTDPDDYAGAVQDPVTGVYKFDPPLDRPPDMDNPNWTAFLDGYTTRERVRVLQLQRLANPLRPWDELTNPYLTVDTAQIDLTVFNGVTNDLDPPTPDYDFYTRERGETTGTNNLWRSELPGDVDPLATAPVSPVEVHWFNEPFQHTLGYLNEPFGAPLSAPPEYVGDPQSAFPWFTWNNRPFVSQGELLKVPALPASQVLTYFNVSTGVDPYTNAAGPFPHLMNFFYQSPPPAAPPAGHVYRLLEYVHVPSAFVGTEIQGDPTTFSGGTNHAFHPPFNRISLYRDPGRVNLNTIFSPTVWQGLISYFPDFNATTFWNWDAFVGSRRGYGGVGGSMGMPNAAYPTFFGNPFRSFAGNELVPIDMNIGEGVNATLLRSNPAAPTQPLLAYNNTGNAYVNTDRNPYFRYQMLQKLGNLVTTRSNVYAIWITVGYFEVDAGGNLQAELGSDTGDIKRHRAFYIFDRSIPVGFQRGEDLNVERAVLLSRFIE